MTTIKEKVQEYLKYKGITPTAAERKLNWGVGAFTKAKSITADRAKEFILLFDDVSAEWLMRGEGSMLKSSPSSIDTISSSANGNTGGINGNVIGDISGNGNKVGIIQSDCEKKLVKAQFESDHLKREVKSLKEQLKQALLDKDKAVADKDLIIKMLDKALSK